ncbi:three prime repair exonuclease 2 [Lasius niger]|uniref:Three prime repair exonuclease 2 n=1 Tax=Lasius niger TaxID=67767 RepID=A0A0J7KIH0_LASNI|nr:three prime repair exonuclease 2 [Lasius niger]
MEIQTFVFFDLETTGLIHGKMMPRITEIALVAVARESMICNSNKVPAPRVLHKLILPINPQKVIPPNVEYMTKLFNEDMLLLQPFECEVYELIKCFLQRLTPPVCFAAHNGNRFDYPIFLHELERINKIFDDKILCIDTWKMFQDFFKKRDSEAKIVQNFLNDEYNDSLSMLDMDMIMMEQEAKIAATTEQHLPSISRATSPYDEYIKVINNKKYDTNKEYNDDIDVESSKNLRQKANEKTPENQIIRQHEAVLAERPFKKSPRKKLDFGCERPVSLKLGAIYEYMFGSNFSHEHSAEADCLAMIRCVTNIIDFFLEWSDNHASPLVCCKRI